MAIKKNFVDDETLMSIVNDIQSYIAKSYKLSNLEYEIILNMLRTLLEKRNLEKRKEEWKSEGNIKSLVKQVFAQVKGGGVDEA